MAVWNFLWPFVLFIPNLECLDQEKSGNPDFEAFSVLPRGLTAATMFGLTVCEGRLQ
jgi:hypothetical protein